jgi:hypothetical protein
MLRATQPLADLFDPSHGQSGLEGQEGEAVEPDSHIQSVPRAVNDLIYISLWGTAAEEEGFFVSAGARPARQ